MLEALGWSSRLDEAFRPFLNEGLVPARVVFASRELYRVRTPDGERLGRLTGRIRHEESRRPVTGDWVAVRVLSDEDALVEAILPRSSVIVRREPGRGFAPQVLAANVDVALVLQPASRVNARSIERYVALAREGGALPVLVVSKFDLAIDTVAAIRAAAAAAPGVALHAVSVVSGFGLPALARRLESGVTAVLLGPSGAGKSSLANALGREDLLATSPVRSSDGRGRHTTTERQMIPLADGAWLLDTPGLREVGLTATENLGFDEIASLAEGCRFRDCRHESEPGCVVLGGAADGSLDPRRLEGFRKLRREAEWAAEREESTAAAVEKRRWKHVMKAARLAPSAKDRRR